MSEEEAARDIEAARRVLATEAEGLRLLAASIDAAFAAAVARLQRSAGRVICTGVGKSGHVARKIAATFASTGAPAYFVHPTEASHGDLGMIQASDVVLALSRSGETPELNDLIQYSRRFGVGLIAITAAAESSLARAADVALILPEAPEACGETNAPTTSTTMMLALGDALAVALLRRRGFDAQSFKLFHPGGKLGAMLKTAADVMRGAADAPLIAAGSSLQDGVAALSEKNLGGVGVVAEDGRLAGIITDGDLRRLLASGRRVETVDEAMTRNPVTVAPETLASAVLATMNERKITLVFVVREGAPVGVVHMHDILKAGII